MMELEFIPLKYPDGSTCGHARVKSGVVEFILRGEAPGEALILTDTGAAYGRPGMRIAAGGAVEAAAIHDAGRLVCCGISRRSRLTLADVRLRLAASPAPKPEPEPEPEPVPEPVEIPPVFSPPIIETEHDAEIISPLVTPIELPEPVPAPEPEPAPEAEMEPEEPDRPSVRALTRRAEAVFRLIEEPFLPRAAVPAPVPAPAPAPAAERTAIANPFPHIFPNARFFRVQDGGAFEHLDGEWVSGRQKHRIVAVPGSYSPEPPPHLSGFTRFIRARIGGFWVRVVEI